MSMVIAHNINALTVEKSLVISSQGLNKAIEKLSSGYRINSGADAPADLVISEQLRAQIVGLERAVRNTTEAINVVSIAEGALNEMNSILKKMKSLAIHAANSGITSPDQVSADQAEMDSAIQTLERIANTTRFSDQFLLNGAKEISFQSSTQVNGTQNNRLVNQGMSRFFQIFKREGYGVSLGFTGAIGANSTTNIGKADLTKSAQKAYLEVDTKSGTLSQIDTDGNLTQGQSFILTGTQGSRQFDFSKGASVSSIVTAIHNVKEATGIDAALIFNSSQAITQTTNISTTGTLGAAARGANNVATLYDNYFVDKAGNSHQIVTSISGCATGMQYGKNTDGQGNLYIKVTANNGIELYKDASLSAESLVAVGSSGTAITARNNSGLSGLTITLNSTNSPSYGSVAILALGGIDLGNTNATVGGVIANSFTAKDSVVHGVMLGTNTDSGGKVYLKVIEGTTAGCGFVVAYRDKAMREQDVVAKSELINLSGAKSVILNQIWNAEDNASTGLGIHLDVKTGANLAKAAATGAAGEISFKNLAARIFSNDYGSSAFIKIQQATGGLFTYYSEKDNIKSASVIGSGSTYQVNGQDASLTVNGQQMRTNGLVLNLATQDVMAKLVFNEGKAGSTTIAQVGYADGSVFTRAGIMTLVGTTAVNGFSGMLANAGHNTQETLGYFQGGMQLQLGEGASDQERTVVSMHGMSTAVMGRIEVTKQFDRNSAVIETRSLSMQDVMGGQSASLAIDPTLAMRIIDQAVNDVSEQRARLGALQSNMLQTNANNLRVAIENITKTESDIRDTDMAAAMTEYTKFMVLSNAGMAMMGQANLQSQAVLQLLG